MTILCRGSNKLVLDESDRSIHDGLCVIRSLVKKKFLIAGGGAPEMQVAVQLRKHANTLLGAEAYCVKAFADALVIIPYTLAERWYMHPIAIVTESRHARCRRDHRGN